MILEGLVTTVDPSGVLNIAPMGPRVEPDMRSFILRPYRTSKTYRNLRDTGVGVLHVTDDVLLLARTAIDLPVSPQTKPAQVIPGRILVDACRYFEFRVSSLDDSQERTTIVATTAASVTLRDFFGLNRAKHAVVEAAILATRVGILPLEEIQSDLRRLAPLVEKTGGPDEAAAFALLCDYVASAVRTAAAGGLV